MVSFRPGRVFAMQALYAMEVADRTLSSVLPGLLEQNPIQENQRAFGMRLIALYQDNEVNLKAELVDLTQHWAWERMPTVDRLVLMLSMIELLHIPETPVKVVLNEATEIAKKFSTTESAGFVNGVLKGFAVQHKLMSE
jgi:N utilization substance protein B